jgi:hypothetical protein
MDSNITDPFYERLTEENVLKFGVCIDEYMGMTGSPNHKEWMEELIREGPDLKTAFLNALGPGLLNSTREEANEHIQDFMKIPNGDMPMYIIELPDPIEKVSCHSPPPEPGQGPLPWQIIFSRWRLITGI